jgi:hypothetical protein
MKFGLVGTTAYEINHSRHQYQGTEHWLYEFSLVGTITYEVLDSSSCEMSFCRPLAMKLALLINNSYDIFINRCHCSSTEP